MDLFLHCSAGPSHALVARLLVGILQRSRPDVLVTVEAPQAELALFEDLDAVTLAYGGGPYAGLERTPGAAAGTAFANLALTAFPEFVEAYGFGLEAAVHTFNRQMLHQGRTNVLAVELPKVVPATSFRRGRASLPEVPVASLFADGDAALVDTLAQALPSRSIFATASASHPNVVDVSRYALPDLSAIADRCATIVVSRRDVALATDTELNRIKDRFALGEAREVRYERSRQTRLLDGPSSLVAALGESRDPAPEPAPAPSATVAAGRPVVLFVSHHAKQCGVHEYGLNVSQALRKSRRFDVRYVECSGPEEFRAAVAEHDPALIIYNKNSLTMAWLTASVTRDLRVPQLGILHEVTQSAADSATNEIVDFHLAQDPTLLTSNPIVFSTPRLLPKYEGHVRAPQRITVGSFGFGVPGKGFENVVAQVCAEFDEADVRLHIPLNDVIDANGQLAAAAADLARGALTKPGVRLLIDHDFFTKEQLLDFCAGNSVNAFFYDPQQHRFGISSVIDYAVAVKRPIAVRDNPMFRPILQGGTPIVIERSSLREIISRGFGPLQQFYDRWSEEGFIAEYERILTKALESYRPPAAAQAPPTLVSLTAPSAPLTPNGHTATAVRPQAATFRSLEASPWAGFAPQSRAIRLDVGAPGVTTFNRILDDGARTQYASIIQVLFNLAPDLMARKIPEANVQQAFVFDTVAKISSMYKNPRILCVGSFEDTAAVGIKKTGVPMVEIDPEINYDLEGFFARPDTVRAAWDIIFSTSVLEHVENDEHFMELVGELLAPGGVAVLTVDFDKDYAPGKPIPPVDYRMYTKRDFTERLIPRMGDVRLLGAPSWDYPAPDFHMAGYNYTFATLVVEKVQPLTATP